MGSSLTTAYDQDTLRSIIREWKAEGLRTALVPTMGALHNGHLELVRRGVQIADRVVVTVFVNPKQFAVNEDLDKYPNDISADKAMLESVGADLVYIPNNDEMYPAGFSCVVSLKGPASVGLEDKYRPQFFDGVTTVVAKLFNQASCDYAMFGEKDFQQLAVVSQMVRDLNIATTIVPVETVREPSGLAMASRNAYLSEKELELAPSIYTLAMQTAANINDGMKPKQATDEMANKLTDLGFRVDYVEARNANTLDYVKDNNEPMRILTAAWLGKTRLIDNIGV